MIGIAAMIDCRTLAAIVDCNGRCALLAHVVSVC